jgi:SAM-dependent methyltransferase
LPGRPNWLAELLKEEVDNRIQRDLRSVSNPGTYLGWPKDRIFWDVLGAGQADFDATVGHLSGEDRALLYAKYNQPRHLDELNSAFDSLFAGATRAGRPTILDLGCGPFTAGLAVAATLGPNRPFRYYGVDRAKAMRVLGERFAEQARSRGALHRDTTYWFGANLDTIDFGPIRGDLTVAVASYLLASRSLNIADLLASLFQGLQRIGPGPVAVLYTNSAEPGPNIKYPAFRDGLKANGFEVYVDYVEVFRGTKTPKKLRYALFFKRANTKVQL